MMKFACFERTVEALYKYVVPKPRSDCSKGEQLVVTFLAGYIGMYSTLLSSLKKYFIKRSLGAVSHDIIMSQDYGHPILVCVHF